MTIRQVIAGIMLTVFLALGTAGCHYHVTFHASPAATSHVTRR
jgi:hypothetical protein